MTDFNKILEKAKEIEKKMKESQENLKKIEVEGMSGGDAVKITLNGDGEMTKILLSTLSLNKILVISPSPLSVTLTTSPPDVPLTSNFLRFS